MKSLIKSTIAVTVLILTIATSVMSQDFNENYENKNEEIKNVYKVGIGKIFVGQFFLGYERIFSDHFSLNTQVGYLRKAFYLETLSEINGRNGSGHIRTENTPGSYYFHRRTTTNFGCQLNFGLRYYPSGVDESFFLEVRGGYQYADFANDLKIFYNVDIRGSRLSSKVLDVKQNSYFYNVILGNNFIFGEDRTIEFYLSIGRRFSKLINPETIEVIPNPNSSTFAEFKNNHLNPIHRMHFEFGIYLGFGK